MTAAAAAALAPPLLLASRHARHGQIAKRPAVALALCRVSHTGDEHAQICSAALKSFLVRAFREEKRRAGVGEEAPVGGELPADGDPRGGLRSFERHAQMKIFKTGYM